MGRAAKDIANKEAKKADGKKVAEKPVKAKKAVPVKPVKPVKLERGSITKDGFRNGIMGAGI